MFQFLVCLGLSCLNSWIALFHVVDHARNSFLMYYWSLDLTVELEKIGRNASMTCPWRFTVERFRRYYFVRRCAFHQFHRQHLHFPHLCLQLNSSYADGLALPSDGLPDRLNRNAGWTCDTSVIFSLLFLCCSNGQHFRFHRQLVGLAISKCPYHSEMVI